MTGPLDLKPIKARLTQPYQGIGAHTDAELWSCYADIKALVAEVERLRGGPVIPVTDERGREWGIRVLPQDYQPVPLDDLRGS